MGERADRQHVDPARRVRGRRLERDPTGHLHEHALAARHPAHQRHATSRLLGGHVVEEHRAGTGSACFLDLVGTVALDLHQAPRPTPAGGGDRLGDGQAAQMVVLHEHGVRQARAVVVATAGANSCLLECPQARSGLAGIENPYPGRGSSHGVDEAAGRRGHAREVPEEVEGGPLAGEDRAQPAPHRGHRLPDSDSRPVGEVPGDLDRRVELGIGLLHAALARHHAGGPGHDGHRGPRVGGDERGRQVTEGQQVLGERPRHGVAHGGEGRVDVPCWPAGAAARRARAPHRQAAPRGQWTRRTRQRGSVAGWSERA